MKTYFSHIDADHWTAKNNAEKQAHQAAREMNHKLIDADKLNAFIADFKDKIEAINTANKRCKPLIFENFRTHRLNSNDRHLYISGVFSMTIIEVQLGPYTNFQIH